jgi:hypothetical protein
MNSDGILVVSGGFGDIIFVVDWFEVFLIGCVLG